MYLIIGLGNPGREYALTRHNIGFEAVDYIAGQKNVQITKDEHEGLTGVYFENGEKVMLVKPMTYMNNSGLCVEELVSYYDVPLENTLVIYDDIDPVSYTHLIPASPLMLLPPIPIKNIFSIGRLNFFFNISFNLFAPYSSHGLQELYHSYLLR